MRSLPTVSPRYGRHLGEHKGVAHDEDDTIDLVERAKGWSDAVESFSVESILKLAVMGSVLLLTASHVVPSLPGGMARALNGGLSLGGELVRAVTTRPVGFVRRLSRDIRGL